MKGKQRAFTLIELLIVVAIIAILAAIAVPNFLEAQTRSKVSATMANMRNIATAMEAYRVDYNGSLPATACNFWWTQRWHFYEGLSTPVSYMTTTPQDPFYRAWGQRGDNDQWGYTTNYFYEYQVMDQNIMKAILSDGTAPGMFYMPPAAQPGYTWPQGAKSCIQTYFLPMFTLWGRGQANYGIVGWGPASAAANGGWSYNHPYDPTNGTASAGNVVYYN